MVRRTKSDEGGAAVEAELLFQLNLAGQEGFPGLPMARIHVRPEAIQFAIDRAKAGDTVLLLGKGHKKTIERADGEHPWDEVAEARKALRSRLSKK